jgi:hypothetical protein
MHCRSCADRIRPPQPAHDVMDMDVMDMHCTRWPTGHRSLPKCRLSLRERKRRPCNATGAASAAGSLALPMRLLKGKGTSDNPQYAKDDTTS